MMKRNIRSQLGITLVELLIASAVLGLLILVAVPQYNGYLERVDVNEAVTDIAAISLTITDSFLDSGRLPADLAAVGMSNMRDPWGNPYQYVNHETAPPGKRRKDKNLVPINSDYDLYSMGEDGKSVPPLTAKHSRDDIVRANDGKWVGKGEDY